MVWVLQLNDGTLNPFLQHPSATFVKELVEVESGGKALFNRSVLQETMDLCCSTNSTLLVEKLSTRKSAGMSH